MLISRYLMLPATSCGECAHCLIQKAGPPQHPGGKLKNNKTVEEREIETTTGSLSDTPSALLHNDQRLIDRSGILLLYSNFLQPLPTDHRWDVPSSSTGRAPANPAGRARSRVTIACNYSLPGSLAQWVEHFIASPTITTISLMFPRIDA